MSGGLAYVYDVKNNFSLMCNKEMVDLDPLNEEDVTELKNMITSHFRWTRSTVAKFILEDFDNQTKNFIKVFPADYKKVLEQQKQGVLNMAAK